jgi:Bifunctional DNA primase/polymerase, N-terminal/Primase C terminal 2 (PriCT-2)/D5 N terminal like
MSDRPSLLEPALAYAEFGWAVLPLHHVENGHCSCGNPKCKSPGKHPLTRHGVKDASKDLAIIKAWCAKWPHANIGIATGSISGLLVVDVDCEKGEAKLAALAERGFTLPPTARVKTGRVGGLHHYLTLSPNASVPSTKDDGLEIKADGSYVVAAGSQHQNGTQYKWIDNNLPAPTPDWLIYYARGGRERTTAPQRQSKRTVGPGLADICSPPTWSEAQEARVRSAVSYISAREYDDWLRVGMALHWTGWDARAFQIFDDWSRTVPEEYKDADLPRKWQSFGRRGDGTEITLGSLFHMAKERGWTDAEFHTDLGNARRLIARHGDDIRFIPEWRNWIVWDGTRWREDDDGAIMRLAKETVESMYAEALILSDEDK